MSCRDGREQFDAALNTLRAVDTDTLSAHEHADFLEDVNRMLSEFDCFRHETTGRFEASGRLLDCGYRTLTQFHRDRLHMSGHEAGRVQSLSRALVHMPTIVKHWRDGNLDANAARAIAQLRTDVTETLFDEAETYLADAAANCDHHDLRTVCKEWQLRADPDGTDPAERDKDAHVSTTFGGGARLDASLDPVGGAIVKTTFDDVVDELFRADWAQAKQRLGREPKLSELARTKAERRHDAMVEIFARARNHNIAGRSRPLITIVTGLSALADGLARLWNDVPLSPDQLADLLRTDPDIQRFVYGTDERPIRYNPKHRLFTGKLREAILTRDRRCTATGCDADTRCGAVDHIHLHGQGGQTIPTNGRGACHPCNRTRPQRTFNGDPPAEEGGNDPP